MGLVAAFCVLARVQKEYFKKISLYSSRPSLFLSFFPRGLRSCMYGGDCKQHRTVMCKNAGLYRSLYSSVYFGLVACKMIYHNSGLTVLKCLNLVRCICRLRIPSKLYNNNNNNVLVLCTRIVYLCSVM